MIDMTSSKFVLEYKFEQACNYTKAVILINAILFIALAIRGWDYILSHPYTWFSLLSGVVLMMSYKFYNWRNSYVNFFFILLYGAFLIYEFYMFGMPDSLLESDSRTISKGFLLDLCIGILPFLYFGMRSFSVMFLIPVFWFSRQLELKY